MIEKYPFPPVDEQARAPLSKRVWTHSDHPWRAAKCSGVAPLSSLMLTNLENPLQQLSFSHTIIIEIQLYTHADAEQERDQVFATGLVWAAVSTACRQSEWP